VHSINSALAFLRLDERLDSVASVLFIIFRTLILALRTQRARGQDGVSVRGAIGEPDDTVYEPASGSASRG
jgi:hypothetical protein